MEDGQSVHTPQTKRTLLTPLSLRGAQRRGNLPEGKTYLRTRIKYSPTVARRPNTRRRWLTAEKSHTIETARCIYAPAYPPAVAHRREIPCNRNENKQTRITDQANDLNATVIARSAKRDVAISRKGRLTCVHGQNTRPWRLATLPVHAHRREIPYNRHGTICTRASLFARGGSPPCPRRLCAPRRLTVDKKCGGKAVFSFDKHGILSYNYTDLQK